MTRVPLHERRRLFLSRQQASQALREELLAPAPAHPLSPAGASHDRLRMVVRAAMIVMLLGVGLIVFQSVTFHLPTSVVEALLPRF